MENVVIEEVVEEAVRKPFRKVFVLPFKWIWLLIKRSGRRTMRVKDMTIIQLIYGLWIRVKWFILGVIGGYLLYYFELFPKYQEWIQSVLDGLG